MGEVKHNSDYIFCAWRRKHVRLTPEEYVRQNFLHRLVEEFHYPTSLIAVEVAINSSQHPTTNDQRPTTLKKYRADAIVYSPDMRPLMLIEFKADTVPLTRQVLDQIAVYNTLLGVPYLILHNGKQTVVAQVHDGQLSFLQSLPEWKQLSH